jgi:protein disulfide-isomerase-like protein
MYNFILVLLVIFCSISFLLAQDEIVGVKVLKDDNFDSSLQDDNTALHFVEFYAPWCGHCKKLEPVLNELANEFITHNTENESSKVKIGKVDATKNRDTANKYGIKSFPTLYYFITDGGVSGKYEGSRSLESMKMFIDKMMSPSVLYVFTSNEIEQILDDEHTPVIFILNINKDTKQSNEVKESFITASKRVHADAHLYINSIPDDGSNVDFTISKMQKGQTSKLMTSNDFNVDEIENFVTANNFELITKFDNHNFKRLGHLNKTMIVLVNDNLNKEEEFYLSMKLYEESIVSLSISADSFVFGYLDAIRWRSFLKKYQADKSPCLLFLDLVMEEYHTVRVELVNKTSINDAIVSFKNGEFNELMKAPFSPNYGQIILKKMNDYYPWSLLAGVPIILLIVNFFMPMPDKKKKKKAD